MKKLNLLVISLAMLYSCSKNDVFKCEEHISKTTSCTEDEINKNTKIDTLYLIRQITSNNEKNEELFLNSKSELISFQKKCFEASISQSDFSYSDKNWSIDKFNKDGIDYISIYDETQNKFSLKFETKMWKSIFKTKYETSYRISSISCDLTKHSSKEVSREEFYK